MKVIANIESKSISERFLQCCTRAVRHPCGAAPVRCGTRANGQLATGNSAFILCNQDPGAAQLSCCTAHEFPRADSQDLTLP